jgi:uncharacterized protein (TIGR04562 family)
MTPYLLRGCREYETALRRATLMMGNRGFDIVDGELQGSEKERALAYVRQALSYFLVRLFPIVDGQLRALAELRSPLELRYRAASAAIAGLRCILSGEAFSALVAEDPRHLFLLASAEKYPELFRGHPRVDFPVPEEWRRMGCATLKMCRLIKAVEEDSQDINDYAQLGIFLESRGVGLADLFAFNWNNPALIPDEEPAQRAFVKLSAFFRKLAESVSTDKKRGCLVFDSGDGVRVDIIEIKARLKSPESMFAKLGKDAEGEAYGIRDILAITFLLKEREDTLSLFHALQKRGVILQENTISTSITQTLFADGRDMEEAVRRLMRNLARYGSSTAEIADEAVSSAAAEFYDALGVNAVRNPHSSDQHRKFQCKINFSLPVHRDASTRRILVPGTAAYLHRDKVITQQHTIPVELRISDRVSWEDSEQRGEAHHDAYKLRQLLVLMNRLFSPLFSFPNEDFPRLREDQAKLFS